jgi:hypothetical protein
MSLLGYRGGMNSGSSVCVMNLWMERFRPAFYWSSDRQPVSPTETTTNNKDWVFTNVLVVFSYT